MKDVSPLKENHSSTATMLQRIHSSKMPTIKTPAIHAHHTQLTLIASTPIEGASTTVNPTRAHLLAFAILSWIPVDFRRDVAVLSKGITCHVAHNARCTGN